MNCIKCQVKLSGKQKKFCSRICKNRYLNSWHQSAERQYKRGIIRKQKLIEMKGGACKKCGYNKIHALSFHHIDPTQKSFSLDIRNLTNRSMKSITNELSKCDLYCLNCHAELEYMNSNSNWAKFGGSCVT